MNPYYPIIMSSSTTSEENFTYEFLVGVPTSSQETVYEITEAQLKQLEQKYCQPKWYNAFMPVTQAQLSESMTDIVSMVRQSNQRKHVNAAAYKTVADTINKYETTTTVTVSDAECMYNGSAASNEPVMRVLTTFNPRRVNAEVAHKQAQTLVNDLRSEFNQFIVPGYKVKFDSMTSVIPKV